MQYKNLIFTSKFYLIEDFVFVTVYWHNNIMNFQNIIRVAGFLKKNEGLRDKGKLRKVIVRD